MNLILLKKNIRLTVQNSMDYVNKLFLMNRKVMGLVTKAISNDIYSKYGDDTTYNLEDFDSIYLYINCGNKDFHI